MKKIILSLSLICISHASAKLSDTTKKAVKITKEAAQETVNFANTIAQETASVADKLLLPVLAYHIGKHSLKGVGCPVSTQSTDKTLLKKAGHGVITLATGVAVLSLTHSLLTTEKARTFIAAHMPHLDRILQYFEKENIAVKIKRNKKA